MLAEIAWDKWYYVVGIAGGLLALWRPVIRPLLRMLVSLDISKEFRPNGGSSMRDAVDRAASDAAMAKSEAREAKGQAREAVNSCKMQDKVLEQQNRVLEQNSRVLDTILKIVQQKHGGS